MTGISLLAFVLMLATSVAGAGLFIALGAGPVATSMLTLAWAVINSFAMVYIRMCDQDAGYRRGREDEDDLKQALYEMQRLDEDKAAVVWRGAEGKWTWSDDVSSFRPKVEYTNNGTEPVDVGGVTVPPGETRQL